MLLKLGVDISRLKPEIRRSLKTVESIFWTLSEREAIITSTFEGSHKVASLHYANQAIDIRLPETKRAEIFQAIADSLGKDYDVINEVDHIHVEYDPKG
jgi:hypothetical protein